MKTLLWRRMWHQAAIRNGAWRDGSTAGSVKKSSAAARDLGAGEAQDMAATRVSKLSRKRSQEDL
jgi:hypothetical protein